MSLRADESYTAAHKALLYAAMWSCSEQGAHLRHVDEGDILLRVDEGYTAAHKSLWCATPERLVLQNAFVY